MRGGAFDVVPLCVPLGRLRVGVVEPRLELRQLVVVIQVQVVLLLAVLDKVLLQALVSVLLTVLREERASKRVSRANPSIS